MAPKTINQGTYNLHLGYDITKYNSRDFGIFNNDAGIYFTASNSYYLNKILKFNFGFHSVMDKFTLDLANNTITYFEKVVHTEDKMTTVNLNFKHVGKIVTMAFLEDINALTALTLTNTAGHQYTGTISTDNKVEIIIDINGSYTASINLSKGMRVAFQMLYGTTSDDIAICFASMDFNGLVTIDLDNVQLSDISPACSYVIYN